MHQVNDTQKYSFPACTLGDLPAAPFFEHFSTQYYCLLRNVDPSQEATDQIGYIRELNQDALKRGACQLEEDILHLLAVVHPNFQADCLNRANALTCTRDIHVQGIRRTATSGLMCVAEKHLCLGYLLHQHGGILPGGGGGLLQEFLGGDVPLGPWTPIPELVQNEVTNTV